MTRYVSVYASLLFSVLSGVIALAPTAWAGVTASMTAPANGSTMVAPVTLSATASANQGYSVSKVEFYQGATLLGTATTVPYTVSWNGQAGVYSVIAKATAVKGNSVQTANSSPITITVNTRPVVNLIQPADSTRFDYSQNIEVNAIASDNGGSVTQVQLVYSDTSGLEVGGVTLTEPPYSAAFTFNPLSSCCGPDQNGYYTYNISAQGIDNQGTFSLTQQVTIKVRANVPPSVDLTTPTQNAIFTAPGSIALQATPADIDGTIAQVEFFANGAAIGTATSAPFSVIWTNASPGSYNLTARATDNWGVQTTSSAVPVLVNGTPTIHLSSPTQNAVFTAPANITLTAQAADADGTVSKVEFFHGSTLITSVTSTPFSFNWTGVPQGAYALTAVATDNQNGTTTSSPVNITVGAALAQLYFIHVDHLNTPRLVANAAGQTVWRWDQQEPFGNNPPDQNPIGLGVYDLPLRLPGQTYDAETGLHYNYYRNFDPSIGRYEESDPIGLRGGLNTYAYVGGNPIKYRDAKGLDRWYDPAWGGGAGQGWWWNEPNHPLYGPQNPGGPAVKVPWPFDSPPAADPAGPWWWTPWTPKTGCRLIAQLICTGTAAGSGIGFPWSAGVSQGCSFVLKEVCDADACKPMPQISDIVAP